MSQQALPKRAFPRTARTSADAPRALAAFLCLVGEASARRAGVQLVPDESLSTWKHDANTVPASEHGGFVRLFEQIGIERHRLRMPHQLRNRHRSAQLRAIGQQVHSQAGSALQLDRSGRFVSRQARNGNEAELGGFHDRKERLGHTELELMAGGKVDVLGAGRHGSRTEFVEPAHVRKCSHEHEPSVENVLVVKLDHDAGHTLVRNLEFELSQSLDLCRGPLGELDLMPRIVKRLDVAVFADESLGLLARHRIVGAVPVRMAGSVALHEGSRGSRQKRPRRFCALFQLGVLRAVRQFLGAVSRVRKCCHGHYPTKLHFSG